MRISLAPTGSARRRFLRSLLTGLPWIGESWLLPKAVGFFEKGPMWPWYRRLFARRQARRINHAIDAEVRQVCIVYDCAVCPLTFGDYLNFIMIMRYLSERGTGAILYIVDGDIFPKHRAFMSDMEIEGFLQGMVDIGRVLLPYPEAQVRRVHDLSEVRQLSDSQDTYVVCAWRTRNKRPLFHHGFSIFNHLMASASSDTQDRVLLSYSDLVSVAPLVDISTPYIAWHARYSENTDPSRNLTTEEFLGIYKILRDCHPNHAILLVSDEVGCRHYSELIREHDLGRIVLSKDYSSTILGDAALILQSDLYCVLRGGGISCVALMSRLPYRCVLRTYFAQMWNDEQLTSWQGRTQVYANEAELDSARTILMS